MQGKILQWLKNLEKLKNSLELWTESGSDKFEEDMEKTDEQLLAFTDDEVQIMLNRLQEAMFIGQFSSFFNKFIIVVTIIITLAAVSFIMFFINWSFPLFSHLTTLALGSFLFKQWGIIKMNYEELTEYADFYQRISQHERFKNYF